MRTVLSSEQVAAMGRVGCGEVSHARASEGGVRSDNGIKLPVVWAVEDMIWRERAGVDLRPRTHHGGSTWVSHDNFTCTHVLT